jgi:hypothetical protein
MFSATGVELMPGQIHTNFVNNIASGSDPGTFPNELVGIAGSIRIKTLVLRPDTPGGFFTLDDLSFGPIESPIPEPATALSMLAGLGMLVLCRTYNKRGGTVRNGVALHESGKHERGAAHPAPGDRPPRR